MYLPVIFAYQQPLSANVVKVYHMHWVGPENISTPTTGGILEFRGTGGVVDLGIP
jgi:hypothetical protein